MMCKVFNLAILYEVTALANYDLVLIFALICMLYFGIICTLIFSVVTKNVAMKFCLVLNCHGIEMDLSITCK